MIFLLHVEWPEMPPYKLLLTYYVWRIVWRAWRPFPWHQAWSWTTLRRGNVFYYVYKRFLKKFCHVFYVFNVFYFYLNVFLHLWWHRDHSPAVRIRADSLSGIVSLSRLLPLNRLSVDDGRYDTIRDTILTCARKPTKVSLIYRTETTTKKV